MLARFEREFLRDTGGDRGYSRLALLISCIDKGVILNEVRWGGRSEGLRGFPEKRRRPSCPGDFVRNDKPLYETRRTERIQNLNHKHFPQNPK